jgi:hypothetical protein
MRRGEWSTAVVVADKTTHTRWIERLKEEYAALIQVLACWLWESMEEEWGEKAARFAHGFGTVRQEQQGG